MSNNPIVTLVSSDDVKVQVTLSAIKQSVTIKTMLQVLDEAQTSNLPIPVPAVDGETLTRVVEWCENICDTCITYPMLAEASNQRGEPPLWIRDFFRGRTEFLFKLVNAANYLEIPVFLNYGIAEVAHRLGGMNTRGMRGFLRLQNDFEPEEEALIREEYSFLFDKLSY